MKRAITISKQQLNNIRKREDGFQETGSTNYADINRFLTSSKSDESGVEHLRQLEAENVYLKQMVQELKQENRALNWIIEKRVPSGNIHQ
ncbi:MAG: hypothetical protein ABFC94_07230 [Syntrophomonas sp.]